MPPAERYSTYSTGPVLVVVFQPNRMLDTAMVEEMAGSLKGLIAHAEEDAFVFDLSGIRSLSSGALGMLLGIQRDLARVGGELKLAGLSEENREVFRITKLDAVFDAYPDADAAVEAFQTRE